MKAKLYHLHALSALHVGVGQAVGAIDLPIARAKGTNLPLVPGSAVKGVLRDVFRRSKSGFTEALFGPEQIKAETDSFAAALAFGDAHLLLLPARAYAGVMCWVTCPFVLQRYHADLIRAAATVDALTVPGVDADAARVPAGNVNGIGRRLVLDDLDLAMMPGCEVAGAWADHFATQLYAGDAAAAAELRRHFAIIGDDSFAFLAETATEIRARIAIDHARGVVKRGALWYEENLPVDSVLWGLLGVDVPRGGGAKPEDAWGSFKEGVAQAGVVQIGGKATVGRGLVRMLLGA